MGEGMPMGNGGGDGATLASRAISTHAGGFNPLVEAPRRAGVHLPYLSSVLHCAGLEVTAIFKQVRRSSTEGEPLLPPHLPPSVTLQYIL